MRVYLRDGSAQTILRAATLRYKLQLQLSISSSPSTDPVTPGAWQSSHWSADFSITEKSWRKRDSNPGYSALKADTLTTRPVRQSCIIGLVLGLMILMIQQAWSATSVLWAWKIMFLTYIACCLDIRQLKNKQYKDFGWLKGNTASPLPPLGSF